MKQEIPRTYEPGKYEDDIYALWEKSGFFNPDNLKLPKNAKAYTIVLPPPNITDKLHLGHGSIIAIEDLLIRFHRMKGYRALYLPGTDHAAIATQNVVEKKLLKEKGLTRQELGKEKFLEEVWNFLRVTQATILQQARKMGGSFDWSREAFTLDDQRKKAVRKMFVDMYDAGVIYRGERIVNWCPRCKSTLADDELEYQGQKTKLYTFKYDKDFPVSIATTRPETKLGDTAVAVNPKDARYKKLIGRTFSADFLGVPLKIKIIADRSVEKDFGTGALGVTPAHSMADWKMAEDNGLEAIKVIDENGKIKNNFGKFSGLAVVEAREMIVAELKKHALLEKEEEIENNLSVCYRCGTAVEPLPSKQWFVAVDKKLKRLGNKSLKEKALEAAKKKKIKFIPFRFTKRYLDWMTNLHDWCISRQIWFGHEIPVYYKGEEIYVGEKPPKGPGWAQDPDTLDTWFSSGMWTFSTLGWPTSVKTSAGKPDKIIKTGDLAKFHPTQVLETGYEIITLWVSRMVMMSLFAVGEIPFENVYLHGMVLDSFGKKMSKSKGNGINPIDMIDKFGTDAVRLSLLIGSTPGNDMRLSEEKIASFRNFVTKLWNIYRYMATTYPDFKLVDKLDKKHIKTAADRWIVSRLQETVAGMTKDLDDYKFSMAGEKLQRFTWDDLADWYLEISKVEKNKYVLGYVLTYVLKLSHPFMPFVTEKIFQDISFGKKVLMVEKWPAADKKLIDKKAEKEFKNLQEIVTQIRNLRASYNIEPNKVITAYAKNEKHKEAVEKLARVNIFVAKSTGKVVVLPDFELDIADVIDVEKEKEKIKKNITLLENTIRRSRELISNKQFMDKSPKEVSNRALASIAYNEKELKEQKELLRNLN
ncbi:MAG: valine--tRNA ligase [Candidatus Pacebacteria bacterium]|nr:valine--tRNA ligase [Candidatus Paceibacterota bacterium]